MNLAVLQQVGLHVGRGATCMIKSTVVHFLECKDDMFEGRFFRPLAFSSNYDVILYALCQKAKDRGGF